MGKKRNNTKTIICYTDKKSIIWAWVTMLPFNQIKKDKLFMKKVNLKYPIKEFKTKSSNVAKKKYREILKNSLRLKKSKLRKEINNNDKKKI